MPETRLNPEQFARLGRARLFIRDKYDLPKHEMMSSEFEEFSYMLAEFAEIECRKQADSGPGPSRV